MWLGYVFLPMPKCWHALMCVYSLPVPPTVGVQQNTTAECNGHVYGIPFKNMGELRQYVAMYNTRYKARHAAALVATRFTVFVRRTFNSWPINCMMATLCLCLVLVLIYILLYTGFQGPHGPPWLDVQSTSHNLRTNWSQHAKYTR